MARLAALVALAAATVAQLGCSSETSAPSAVDRGALFDEMWHEFDLHYSFFQLKNVNWDSLRTVYRPAADSATTDSAFAGVIASMLRTLRDVHVSLTANGAGGTMRYVAPCEGTPTYFSPELITRAYLTGARYTSGGHLRYGMLTPTIGYVAIHSFEGSGWDGEIDDALAALPSASALVVDVRDNGGGDEDLAVRVAGRFADRSRTFGYVRLRNGPSHGDFTDYIAEAVSPQGSRFRGQVALLTNRHDFSSAEDFNLAMRVLPTVTVVGDTTAGASGGPIVRELANGWTYQLSEWIEYTPARQTFEGMGLAPAIAVMQTGDNLAHGVDAQLDRAIALLQAPR